MNIVVTGGAGFIGSEMVRQLASTSNRIIVIDSLTYAGNKNSLASVIEKIQFEKIDIRNKEAVKEFFVSLKVDSVVNFAAETHVDNSINNPAPFLTTNILGVTNLLDCAAKFNIEKF